MPTPSAFSWFEPCLRVDPHRFVVHSHNENFVFLDYEYQSATNKPFISTLCGASGRNMLESSPADHLHHHGIWWGHGSVNGVDFYLELPHDLPHGTITHIAFTETIDDRPRFGFDQVLAWVDHTGATLIDERRALRINFRDLEHYTVDLDSTYTARTDLTFGDTKESVLPGIRVAETMTGAVGGSITSSEGLTGEKATFGQPARWVDISATRSTIYMREEVTEGIACFDHPANPGHPTRWFTREYGPFSPFEGHHFYEDRFLTAGASLRLRHRLVVHRGPASQAGLDDKYARYCEEVPL
jgi:hypothetical protein